MIEIICNSITVTTESGQHAVRFDVQRLEGAKRESLALSVIVPDVPSQTIGALQQAALGRAIEILQSALSERPK